MKILVAYKRVVDYNVRIQVKPDGSGVVTDGVKLSVNPFDDIALEEALRLREKGFATEVIIATIGPADAQAHIRNGLAMGANRAIHIVTTDAIQPLTAARALLKLIEKEQPGIVLLGKQAIDDDCNQTGQMLAALWDRPQATFASKIEINSAAQGSASAAGAGGAGAAAAQGSASGSALPTVAAGAGDGMDAGGSATHGAVARSAGAVITAKVTREVDAGLETIEVDLPAVITTDLRLNEPRFIKLPDIMKAKAKPIETLQLADLGIESGDHLKTTHYAPPAKRQKGVMVKDVSELVSALQTKGLL